MSKLRSVSDIIRDVPTERLQPIPAPKYTGTKTKGIALAVESMKRHTTDEGWQIMAGVASHGYTLCGRGLEVDESDVAKILEVTNPGIVFVQDKREWGFSDLDFRDKNSRFQNIEVLKNRHDLFKLTILKDCQASSGFHIQSAKEMGVHAWVVYYHPKIVAHLARYVRPQHLIRTYHSLNYADVPDFDADPKRDGCLLSGADAGAYPLRRRLFAGRKKLYNTFALKHPGYHVKGCETPAFLERLSHYKVSICTSSRYGYALRKIAESTACGCVVISDLPVDEVMPEIDENIIRVPSDISIHILNVFIKNAIDSYDPKRQRLLAEKACFYYDYCEVGRRLVQDISNLRDSYANRFRA